METALEPKGVELLAKDISFLLDGHAVGVSLVPAWPHVVEPSTPSPQSAAL